MLKERKVRKETNNVLIWSPNSGVKVTGFQFLNQSRLIKIKLKLIPVIK
jgi:hypothetical protein